MSHSVEVVSVWGGHRGQCGCGWRSGPQELAWATLAALQHQIDVGVAPTRFAQCVANRFLIL